MMPGYAIAEGAGTQVLTNLPWVLFVGKPGGLSRAVLILAGWAINLAVAEWAFRTRPTKPTRTAMVPTDRGRDVLYGAAATSSSNNIAWFLRHLPVFAIPGSGSYRIQPVYVEDHADMLLRLGSEEGSTEVDSVGPDVYRFDEFAHLIRRAVGGQAAVVGLPPWAVLSGLKVVGLGVRDVVLT